MVTLFLFEFSVVLLGVLAAQRLANWAREREADAEVLSAKAAMEGQIARSYATAIIWERALPCLEQQVSDISRIASAGEPLPSALAMRPALHSRELAPLGTENALRLTRAVGADQYEYYDAAVQHTNAIDELAGTIAREWVQFSRVDPEYGQIREGDILAARDAAAKIRSSLRTLAISVNAIKVAAKGLEQAPHREVFDGKQVLPLENCSQLETGGAIYRLE